MQPEDLLEALVFAFGHSSDPKKMNAFSLKGGHHGIGGLCESFLTPLVCKVPRDSGRYHTLVNHWATFCTALIERLQEFMKVNWEL